MKSEVYKRKVDTRYDFLAHILRAAIHVKKYEINSDEQHVIFAREMQSALRLTVGFSNIYCELIRNLFFSV